MSYLDLERHPGFWATVYLCTALADLIVGAVWLLRGQGDGWLFIASGGAIVALVSAWRDDPARPARRHRPL